MIQKKIVTSGTLFQRFRLTPGPAMSALMAGRWHARLERPLNSGSGHDPSRHASGQSHREARAGVGRDVDGTAVREHDLVDDREPEPGAAGVSSAGIVETGEALEDPLAVGLVDAGTVVGHAEACVVVGLLEAQRHGRVGVADRVVEQVAHDARELIPVALDLGPRDSSRVDAYFRSAP